MDRSYTQQAMSSSTQVSDSLPVIHVCPEKELCVIPTKNKGRGKKRQKLTRDVDLPDLLYPAPLQRPEPHTLQKAPITSIMSKNINAKTFKPEYFRKYKIDKNTWEKRSHFLHKCKELMYNSELKVYVHGVDLPGKMTAFLNQVWTVRATMTSDGTPYFAKDSVLSILEMIEVKISADEYCEKMSPTTDEIYAYLKVAAETHFFIRIARMGMKMGAIQGTRKAIKPYNKPHRIQNGQNQMPTVLTIEPIKSESSEATNKKTAMHITNMFTEISKNFHDETPEHIALWKFIESHG